MDKFRESHYNKRWGMTLAEWMDYMAHIPMRHQGKGICGYIRWMGVPLKKTPLDMWIYQELIFSVKPDIVIEIGARFGGSTLFFAHLLEIMGKGKVISIDNDRSRYDLKHSRIIELTGNSDSREIVKEAQRLCSHKTVLINHDGDHRKDQVAKDLSAYCNLVTVGSYYIVEDTHIDIWPLGHRMAYALGGPLMAVRAFLDQHPEFVMDQSLERYVATYCPRGFLRRIP